MASQIETPSSILGAKMKKYWKHRGGSIHLFQAFVVEGAMVRYSTDKDIFECSLQTFASEMANWHQPSESELLAVGAVQVVTTVAAPLPELPKSMGDFFTSMNGALQAAIDKVSTDPTYIGQAGAINEIAKTQVQAVRVQLEAYKLLK